MLYVARIVFICRKFLVIFGKCYIRTYIRLVFLASGTVFFPKELFCDACLLLLSMDVRIINRSISGFIFKLIRIEQFIKPVVIPFRNIIP